MSFIYTIMPLDLVMAGFDEGEEAQVHELPIEGGTLLVEPLGKNQARILRVISSDPQLYLRPGLQPGRVIEFPYNLDN